MQNKWKKVKQALPQKNDPRRKFARKLTKTCLSLSFTFIMLTTPYCLLSFIAEQEFVTNDEQLSKVFLMVVFVLYLFFYLNHCINCIIYCMAGQEFRENVFQKIARFKQLCFIYCCRCNREQNSFHQQ